MSEQVLTQEQGAETGTRSVFRTKIGFVLAAAGSAVGLGNVWRFPYFAATYGGGTFLFAYLVVIATFGLVLMTAEISLGRWTRLSPLGAFNKAHPKFALIGVLAMLVPVVIFPYYSVIGGWVFRYAFTFLTGGAGAAAESGYFGAFTGGTWGPIFWLSAFIAVNAVLVARGVQKGIERINVIAMPVFIVMIVSLAIYALTLPGAAEGVGHYLLPDFGSLSVLTFIAAIRQAFFSLSLAMGIMITYGSYLKRSTSIEKSVLQIGLVDTGVSFVAGLLVIPSVVAFMGIGGLGQGAGLMFVTLPQVFASMPGGAVIGALFFTLMGVAAITSGISLMEVPVATVMERFGLSRGRSTLVVAVGSLLLALPTTLGFGIWSGFQVAGMNMLGVMSFISDTALMPVVALGTVILAGWVLGPKRIAAIVTEGGAPFRGEKLFTVMTKWVAPVLLVGLLVTAFLMAAGVITL